MTRHLSVRHHKHITFIINKGHWPPKEVVLTNLTWLKMCKVICRMNKAISPALKCCKKWNVTRALSIVIKKNGRSISAKILACGSIKMNTDDWEYLVKLCHLELEKRTQNECPHLSNMIDTFNNLTICQEEPKET